MPKIVITRKSEWMNRLKRFSVLINAKEIGTVKSGGTEEFSTTIGLQEIECKINWYYSNKFIVDIKDGETVYLKVKNNTKNLMFLFIGIVLLFLSLTFLGQKGYIIDIGISTARFIYSVFLLAYFFYMLTVGRKKYLLLQPDTSNPFA